jgi:hypothetical protein
MQQVVLKKNDYKLNMKFSHMKQILKRVLSITLIGFLLIGCTEKTIHKEDTTVETASKELDDAFKKMWENVTLANAATYFKTDVSDTFFTVNADGIIQNKEQYLEDTERQRMLEILDFKFFDQQIKVFGDVGIINGRIQAFSENIYVGEVFYTAIFVKYNDTWKYENWQGTWTKDSPPPPSFVGENKAKK